MPTPRRTALITGAGRNIGRACALLLARDGIAVALNGSSDRAACESVAAELRALGAEAHVVMGDVGTPETCARIAEEAAAALGPIDILVNNAALRPHKPFLDFTAEEWRRVIAVDLEAALHLTRAVLPGMLERGWGRIVNFTGMNAIQGQSGGTPLSVAKHGAWGFTKALAKEVAARGVTVNAISPGPIASDDEPAEPNAARLATIARVPAGRLGTPAETAAVLRTLVSEEGAYINGQMIQVNGGTQT